MRPRLPCANEGVRGFAGLWYFSGSAPQTRRYRSNAEISGAEILGDENRVIPPRETFHSPDLLLVPLSGILSLRRRKRSFRRKTGLSTFSICGTPADQIIHNMYTEARTFLIWKPARLFYPDEGRRLKHGRRRTGVPAPGIIRSD